MRRLAGVIFTIATGALGCSIGTSAGESAPSTMPIAAITYDTLFVVNGGDASISVIDTSKNEVTATIAIRDASFPHHISLSADRSKVLVAVPGMDFSMGHQGGANGVRGAVLLLDAPTGKTLAARTLPAMNHNAAFAPGGEEVWTSQMMDDGTVLVLDPTSLDTVRSIPVGMMPAEVTFSVGGRAFVANGMSDDVSVIDPATKRVEDTVSVGMDPVGAWQGANGVAYVDNEMGKSLTAIDTQTLALVRTYGLGFTPGMAALGPDGNVWVTDGDHGAVVLKSAASDVTIATIPTGDGAHGIAFAGDGKTVYVSNQMADTVSVIDVASQSSTKTIHVGRRPNGVAWRAK